MYSKIFAVLAAIFSLCSCYSDAESDDAKLKVRLLYNSLVESNMAQAEANLLLVNEGRRFAQYNYGDYPRKLVSNSDTIHEGAQRIIRELHAVRRRLYKASQGWADASVTGFAMEDGNRQLVRKLLIQIDDYATKVHTIDPSLVRLQLIPAKIATVADVDSATKFYFATASVAGAFAALAQIESKILFFEKEALKLQQNRIGCNMQFVSDHIDAAITAESNVVTEGLTYKAKMYLTRTLVASPQTMLANGQPIPIDADGQGDILIPIEAAGLTDDDKEERSWLGEIRTTYKGRDTTFKVVKSYMVRAK